MKCGDIEIVPSEHNLFIVKWNNKYVKLGKKELKYLLELKQIDCNEISFAADEELSEEAKKLLKVKLEELGVVDSQKLVTKKKVTKSDISMIRLLNINPDKFLSFIFPICKYIYSKTFLIGYIVLNIVLAVLMYRNVYVVQEELMHFHITVEKVVIIGIAVLITTALHELGHAIACKKFGGTVSEMGICMFFFLPCLYCNVSGIYMFQRKRERVCVSLAGLFQNSLLSDIALFLYFIIPRESICSSFLFMYYVVNVGIIIFNLIPFVKLDGYWFLTAVLGVDNLITKSIILALVSLLDVKQMKKVTVSLSKKVFMVLYGWVVILFRPIFWYWSIIELNKLFSEIPVVYIRIILLVVISILAIGDTLKFYVNNTKKYINERMQIIGLI